MLQPYGKGCSNEIIQSTHLILSLDRNYVQSRLSNQGVWPIYNRSNFRFQRVARLAV